jgi:hypothetical protein
MDEDKDQQRKPEACVVCGHRGGRRRINPYKEEIQNERVVERIHDACYQELLDEI